MGRKSSYSASYKREAVAKAEANRHANLKNSSFEVQIKRSMRTISGCRDNESLRPALHQHHQVVRRHLRVGVVRNERVQAALRVDDVAER